MQTDELVQLLSDLAMTGADTDAASSVIKQWLQQLHRIAGGNHVQIRNHISVVQNDLSVRAKQLPKIAGGELYGMKTILGEESHRMLTQSVP